MGVNDLHGGFQESLSVIGLMPMSEGLSLMLIRREASAGAKIGNVVNGGAGGPATTYLEEPEEAGIIEPAMEHRMDVPLEGSKLERERERESN